MPYTIIEVDGRTIQWYKEDKKPKLNEKIHMFHATQTELEVIKARFKGIPICEGNFCAWKGVFAEFIFDNL
jgi:hypothetical protein